MVKSRISLTKGRKIANFADGEQKNIELCKSGSIKLRIGYENIANFVDHVRKKSKISSIGARKKVNFVDQAQKTLTSISLPTELDILTAYT